MKWSITSDFGKMYQRFRTGFMVHLHMTSQLNKNIKPAITVSYQNASHEFNDPSDNPHHVTSLPATCSPQCPGQ